jgi:hypothetical protein
MFSNEKNPKKPQSFCCNLCHFNSSNKKDYTRHIQTTKHKINENQCFSIKNTPKNPNHECVCGKKYADYSGLWRHNKICDYKYKTEPPLFEEEPPISLNKDDIIEYLMKENSEFKEMIIEQNKLVMKMCEKNTPTINNINSNNKTFNLNVFLNEHCKDAMNINDFVDSLKLQLSDLENVGKLGFVEGISNIIVKNLRAMDIHKRPVHCSDSKREVMYIKDEDKWEKENEEKIKLRKVIKKIADKNSRLLRVFKEKYPDCIYSDSKKSDQYNKLIVEAMGGSGNEDVDNENKIIKKIAKEVTIYKQIE